MNIKAKILYGLSITVFALSTLVMTGLGTSYESKFGVIQFLSILPLTLPLPIGLAALGAYIHSRNKIYLSLAVAAIIFAILYNVYFASQPL